MTHQTFFVDDGTGHKYKDTQGKDQTARLYTDQKTGRQYKWADLMEVSIITPPIEFAKQKAWEEKVCHQVDCINGVGSWSSVFGGKDH